MELSVGRERVLVKSELPTGSEPPKIDNVLLRRETPTWTEAQRAMLPDGVRDTDAHTILLEFKYTESLTLDALLQAVGYEYFYRTSHELRQDEVKIFVLCAKTPQPDRLATFGYRVTDLPGVYRSDNIYVAHITLLVLNELRDEPHNALVKAFASRPAEKAKAFGLLRRFWQLSAELLLMLEVLQTIWSLPEGATMNEILTPERVMAIGEEWKRIFLSHVSPEDLDAYLNPEYKDAILKAGKIETIERILQRRLGEIPAIVRDRLSQCALDALNDLVNPALDAETWAEFMVALPKQAP
jgi:hypothetical protein